MKPQEFIDKWLGWAKNKEEINDEILADLDAMNKALSIPIVSKRLLEVKFRYLNRTDAIIHSDTFEAETSDFLQNRLVYQSIRKTLTFFPYISPAIRCSRSLYPCF